MQQHQQVPLQRPGGYANLPLPSSDSSSLNCFDPLQSRKPAAAELRVALGEEEGVSATDLEEGQVKN